VYLVGFALEILIIVFNSVPQRDVLCKKKNEIKSVFNLTGFFDCLRNVTKWIACVALVLTDNRVQMEVA